MIRDNRKSTKSRLSGRVAALLIGICLIVSTSGSAFEVEDWVAKLPAKLREAIANIDWQRYEVVPQPLGYDAGEQAGMEGMDGLQSRYPGNRRVEVDARTRLPLLIEGKGIPWIPGAGNDLVGASFGIEQAGEEYSIAEIAAVALAFGRENRSLLGVDPDNLVLDRGTVSRRGRNNRFWSLRLHQVVRDPSLGVIPVRDAYLFFRVGHGNLIQFGNRMAVPQPGVDSGSILSRSQALDRALALVDDPENVLVADPVIDLGQEDRSLQIVPANGPDGSLEHDLVRSFLLETEDYSVEMWLDSNSGELVRVINRRLTVDEVSPRGPR